jgi:hypothetical protein
MNHRIIEGGECEITFNHMDGWVDFALASSAACGRARERSFAYVDEMDVQRKLFNGDLHKFLNYDEST